MPRVKLEMAYCWLTWHSFTALTCPFKRFGIAASPIGIPKDLAKLLTVPEGNIPRTEWPPPS